MINEPDTPISHLPRVHRPMPVLDRFASLLDQARRALLLVWGTSRGLFLGLVLATLIAGVLPALAAWLGQRIVDAVVTAMQLCSRYCPQPSVHSRSSSRCCGCSWGRRSTP